MPIVPPLPWRVNNGRIKNKRTTVLFHGHRRFVMATAEEGVLLSSVSPFSAKSDIENVLPMERAYEAIRAYMQEVRPRKVFLLWTKPKEDASASRMFVTGQILAMSTLACKEVGKLVHDLFLDDLKFELFQGEFVSNGKLVSAVREKFPEMGDDEALAVFAAISKTSPPLYAKKLAF